MQTIQLKSRDPKELVFRIMDHQQRGATIKKIGTATTGHDGDPPFYWAIMIPKPKENENGLKAHK